MSNQFFRVNTTERLAALREEMRRKGLQAYIVPLGTIFTFGGKWILENPLM